MKQYSKIISIITLSIAAVALFGFIFTRTTVYSAPVEELSTQAAVAQGYVTEEKAEVIESTPPTPSIFFEKKSEKSTSLKPARLQIPALDIDAKVQDVGVTVTGKMGVPRSFSSVGWYKFGAIPGEMGSAVIAGHVNNGLALPGIFKDLEDLKVGDDVYVTAQNGTVTHFVVSEQKIYDKDAPASEVFAKDGPPMLRLITCTGNWLPNQRTHENRLVVTATLVP